MKQYALIKVTLLFDPAEVWQHTSQFDKSFADFLASIGMEAQEVNVTGGSPGEKLLLVKKKEPLIEIPQQEDKGPQAKLNEMKTKSEPKKGKMLWGKGYLKK